MTRDNLAQVAEPTPHLPLIEAQDPKPEDVKPTWRGWIHAGTTPVAIAAGIILICLADGAVAKFGSAVFFATSLLLFGNSAIYHRINWRPKMKRLLKRIDHANIFLLIAGTYTPLLLVALPPNQGLPFLAVIWTVAILGVLFRIFWIGAPRWLYVALYILLGWAALIHIVGLFQYSTAMMTLVLVGGVLYTIGAVAYGLKKPNPFPGRFGFHEIFHTYTVLAFLAQWTGILIAVLINR